MIDVQNEAAADKAAGLAAERASPPPPLLALAQTSLFLDVDGTLAGFEATPEAVGPDRARTELLVRLSRALQGRIAAVSGRTLEEIDRILSGSLAAAAGVHGLQRRRASGEVVSLPPHAGLVEARTEILSRFSGEPGFLLEDKGLALALHVRRASWLADAVAATAAQLAERHGLALQRGDMVVELKTPGADKGAAVTAFMAELPFDGGRPVFVGDDLTDEDGFASAVALGGYGVLVGEPRTTLAAYRLKDVRAVLRWLADSLEA